MSGRAGWREGWDALRAHAEAREALAAALEDRAPLVEPAPEDVRRPARAVACDALVTHDELNERHGTGLLLLTIFGRGRGLLTVRSHGFFGGRQGPGLRAVRLPLGDVPRPEVYARALQATRGLEVRRILCVPYYEDDARTAVALHDLFAAPLCTWVMDDQNVADHRISDVAMGELLARSRLRLAIGPELRDAYEEKFRLPFHLAPPLVRPEDALGLDAAAGVASRVASGAAPGAASGSAPGAASGSAPGAPMLVGNVWGQRWLDALRSTVREAGLRLDWTSPSAYRFERFTLDALEADGIRCLGTLPGAEYRARLRAAPFVVVPTGTLAPGDDRAAVARFSVPSRMVFTLAAAHTPMIVVGSAETAAARFVARLGVGRVVPYQAGALRAAAAWIAEPTVQAALRARAAALAPRFSAAGMEGWLWESLRRGAPADDRFEPLGHDPGAEGTDRWASAR